MPKIGKFIGAAAGALFAAACFAAAAPPVRSESAVVPGLSGTTLKMTNPKYSSGARDGRHYEVTAASATQTIGGDGETKLEQPRVELGFANGSVLRLSGATGLLRQNADSLSVRGNVALTAASGRIVELDDATIDLRNNTLTSETHIETGLQKSEHIRAHHLEVDERGMIVLIYGAIVRPEGVVFFDRYALE